MERPVKNNFGVISTIIYGIMSAKLYASKVLIYVSKVKSCFFFLFFVPVNF
jgi:hypothetical protein